MSIARKEARETRYWLRIIQMAEVNALKKGRSEARPRADSRTSPFRYLFTFEPRREKVSQLP